MNRDGLLEQMHQHHQAISDFTVEATGMLGNAELDPEAVSTARWQFVRVLTAYQMFKHQQIFDPMLRHGSQLDADAARQLKAECILISEAFRSYIGKWSTSGIAGHEEDYRCEAHGMILRVRTHITREGRGIERLLSKSAEAA